MLETTLHVDRRPEMVLRSRLFGHKGIIPFTEGLIAKEDLNPEEFLFYQSYSRFLPQEVIPEVTGFCEDKPLCDDLVSIKMREDSRNSDRPVLLMRDIAGGYERPCFLDIKLGIITWEFGADSTIVARRKMKCSRGTAGQMKLRIRAAIWYAEDPEAYPSENGINFVDREFGASCTRTEFGELLADFLRHDGHIEVLVKKLTELKRALVRLRADTDARMFSSSVFIVYDDAHPERIDCRLLDFAKTYFHVKEKAAQYHEKLEDCEDGVLPAVSNLIDVLLGIANGGKPKAESL